MSRVKGAIHGDSRLSGMAILICAMIAAVLSPMLGEQGQATAEHKPTEYEVKAAYLYNFGKFARWPADAPAGATFNICILGRDPFGATLDTIVKNETIEGKPLAISRIAAPEEATACRIVFVSDSEARRLPAILPVLGKSPVLTVSDLPEFASRGGMIQFVRDGERIRFEVNLKAAEPERVTFSSELLRVAARVTGGGK